MSIGQMASLEEQAKKVRQNNCHYKSSDRETDRQTDKQTNRQTEFFFSRPVVEVSFRDDLIRIRQALQSHSDKAGGREGGQ